MEPAWFSISASGSMKPPSVMVNATWAIPSEGDRRSAGRYEILTSDQFGELNSIPVLEVVSGDQEWIRPLEMITSVGFFFECKIIFCRQ